MYWSTLCSIHWCKSLGCYVCCPMARGMPTVHIWRLCHYKDGTLGLLKLAYTTVEVFDWHDSNDAVKEQEWLKCKSRQAGRQYQTIGGHLIPPWKTLTENTVNKAAALENYLSVYIDKTPDYGCIVDN